MTGTVGWLYRGGEVLGQVSMTNHVYSVGRLLYVLKKSECITDFTIQYDEIGKRH